MYVLNVIPFSRSAPLGTLSYRSRDALAPGTLVSVTLRRKAIRAMVVECHTVAEAKAMLKAASFTLVKSDPTVHGVLPEPLLTAAQKTAAYHAVPLGTLLAALFAPSIAEDMPPSFDAPLRTGDTFSYDALERPMEERRAAYEECIRADASKQCSTLLVVPTLAEMEYWKVALAEFQPAVLSGSIPLKQRHARYAAAYEPGRLVITTPSFSWVPIPELGSILVERASAGSYRMLQRPYADFRVALSELARARSLPLVFGDYPLPLEYRSRPDRALDAVPSGSVEVLNVRKEKDVPAEGPWRAVPVEAIEGIRSTLDAGGRALVVAVRHGYAPAVVCRDCGLTLVDERGIPYTFTTQGGKRLLRTADGLSERAAELVCPQCASWNLLPLGIGIERVVEELRQAFPDARIIELLGDLRTLKAARTSLADAELPGTIVAGTEAMLPWLAAVSLRTFDMGVLASADSLLAVPFWRARERLVRLGLSLRQSCAQLLIATRLADDAAIQQIVDPQEAAFFAEESLLRKALGYPPFGTLVALQAEATRARLEPLDAAVRKSLGPHAYTVLPDRPISHTLVRRSFVLHLPRGEWPDAALAERLERLPQGVRVLIDPEAF